MSEFLAAFDRFAAAHPLGDWIAVGIIFFGLACLSFADWRSTRNRPR